MKSINPVQAAVEVRDPAQRARIIQTHRHDIRAIGACVGAVSRASAIAGLTSCQEFGKDV